MEAGLFGGGLDGLSRSSAKRWQIRVFPRKSLSMLQNFLEVKTFKGRQIDHQTVYLVESAVSLAHERQIPSSPQFFSAH